MRLLGQGNSGWTVLISSPRWSQFRMQIFTRFPLTLELEKTMSMLNIPGYELGARTVPRSPLSIGDFELLKKSVLFTDDDVKALRMSLEVLRDQTEAVLDVWYGFIGSNPHLLESFIGKSGKPDANYLGAVRKRFGQWILDTAAANYDQGWLDYQYEIGLRHHRTKKNTTDHADAADVVPLRYILAVVYPVTATLKPFLGKKGHSAEDVERMHQAWIKSVLLQAILWSEPYIKDGDF